MGVTHILRDGTRLTDITGHVVQFEDAEDLYRFIHNINLGRSAKYPKIHSRNKTR